MFFRLLKLQSVNANGETGHGEKVVEGEKKLLVAEDDLKN